MRTLVYIIFSLCMLTALHSCNDNQVDVTKTPEELYEDSLDLRFEQMDRDQLIYNLCTIDSSANGKVSYIPRHGKVLNEGTPTTRYIGVETLEEAMNYFKTSIALPPQEEDADNWVFTNTVDIADCHLKFTESHTADEIARIIINCPELKDVMTDIIFIPRSLWPTNDVSSPIQYGAVWMEKPTPGSTELTFYICVRPCGYGQKGILLTFDSGWGSISYNECTYFQGAFDIYSGCGSSDAFNAFYDMINEFPNNNRFKAAIDHIKDKCIEWYALENSMVLDMWAKRYGTRDKDEIIRKMNKTYDICMKALNKEYLHFNVGSPNPSNPKDAEHYYPWRCRWYYIVNVTYYTMTYDSEKGRYKKSSWTRNFDRKNTPYNVWPSHSFEFDYGSYPENLIKVGK